MFNKYKRTKLAITIIRSHVITPAFVSPDLTVATPRKKSQGSYAERAIDARSTWTLESLRKVRSKRITSPQVIAPSSRGRKNKKRK